MKTGCGVEDLQFTAVERLQPAIALLSAVALTLLDLRDASRREDAKTRPATTVVSREYVAALTAWRYGEVRLKITVHEFYSTARHVINGRCGNDPPIRQGGRGVSLRTAPCA